MAIRIMLDQISSLLGGLWGGDDIFGDFVPGKVGIDVAEVGIAQDHAPRATGAHAN